MVNYEKGKIYKILNNINEDIYVGSTTQSLDKILYEYKYRPNIRNSDKYRFSSLMRAIGIDKFYIELIENHPCDTITGLKEREGYWARKIGTLNIKGCECGRSVIRSQPQVDDRSRRKSRQSLLNTIKNNNTDNIDNNDNSGAEVQNN
jgi:hypothetical protein